MTFSTASGQWIVAHRGASHAAPENTIAAFDLAWQEGADGIEGDFRLTADGQIVCIHDEDTLRTAGKKLVVAESTLDELRRLDIGKWKSPEYVGQRISTLAEVLESIPEGKQLMIELKTGPEIVKPLVQVLADCDVPPEQLTLIAFDANVVRECKQRLTNIRAHWLVRYRDLQGVGWQPNAAAVSHQLAGTGADGLGSEARKEVFNQSYLASLRDSGLREFHVWTVDDLETARFYRDLDVRSITTNRPGWLRQQLAEQGIKLTSPDEN